MYDKKGIKRKLTLILVLCLTAFLCLSFVFVNKEENNGKLFSRKAKTGEEENTKHDHNHIVNELESNVKLNAQAKLGDGIKTIDLTGLVTGTDATHTHIYEKKYDGTYHWEQCFICNNIRNKAAHNMARTDYSWGYKSCYPGNSYTYYCKDGCGYSYTTKDECVANGTWSTVPLRYLHTQNCINCGVWMNTGGCVDANGNRINCQHLGKCAICGYNYTEPIHHPNNNGYCEFCGKQFVKCVSSNVTYSNDYSVAYLTWRIQGVNGGVLNGSDGWYKPVPTAAAERTVVQNGYNDYTYTYKLTFSNDVQDVVTANFDSNGLTIDGYTCHWSGFGLSAYRDHTAPSSNSINVAYSGMYKNFSTKGTITAKVNETFSNYVEMRLLDSDQSTVMQNWKAATENNDVFTSSFDVVAETSATKDLYVQSRDRMGNTCTQKITIANIDSKPPTYVSARVYTNPWSITKAITFTASEEGSGDVQIAFNNQNDFALATKNGTQYSRTYIFTGDVYNSVVGALYLKDALGNITTQKITIGKLDYTAPTVTNVAVNKITNGDYVTATMKPTANDYSSKVNANGSGVSKYKITKTNTAPSSNDSDWQDSDTFNVKENGTYYLWAKDAAGNVSNLSANKSNVTLNDLKAPYKVNHYLMNKDMKTYALQQTETFSGIEGSTVTPKTKTYAGFIAPNAQSAVVKSDGSVVINYYYTRRTDLSYTVNYLEKDTNIVLHEKKTVKNNMFEATVNSVSEKIDIEGYTYNSVIPENITIDSDESKNVINVYYLQNTSVEVQYKNKYTGQDIAQTKIYPGVVGDSFDISKDNINIDGYTLIEEPEIKTGKMDYKKKIFIYYYAVNTKVNVKYVDMYQGNSIFDDVVLNGYENLSYTTEGKKKDGYTLLKTSENLSGKMTPEPINVTYYYGKNTSIKIKYIDKENNTDLEVDKIVNGYVNQDYDVKPVAVKNYKYDESNGKENGKMQDNQVEVIFKYIKETGINVKYVDKYTNEEIVKAVHHEGYSTIPYDVGKDKKDIEGYTYLGDSGNTFGTFENVATEVIFYYAFNVKAVAKYIDLNSKEEITDESIIESYQGQSYEIKSKSIDGYTFSKVEGNEKGTFARENIEVNYYYLKNSGVNVKYIDKETGKELIDSTELKGTEGEKYKLEPKEIPGYTLIEMPTNEEGYISSEVKDATFTYAKNTTVKIVCKDEKTGKEIYSYEIDGYVGKDYKIDLEHINDIEGYSISKMPDNIEGKMQDGEITVEVLYDKKVESKKEETKIIDNTTAKTPIPQTGAGKTLISAIVIIAALGAIAVIGFIRNKDAK